MSVLKKVVIAAFKYFGIFFAAVLFTFITTKGDYHFNTAPVERIDSDMLRSSTHYSYFQYYEMHTPLQFRLDIANEDSKRGTLLWPQEPYSKVLILTDRTDDAINHETVFKGRLVNCLYKCLPSNMPIVMDDFVDMITTMMPQYKDKENSRLLPTLIFDTIDKPRGIKYYLKLKQYHFMAVGLAFLLGVGLMVWDLVKKMREEV